MRNQQRPTKFRLVIGLVDGNARRCVVEEAPLHRIVFEVFSPAMSTTSYVDRLIERDARCVHVRDFGGDGLFLFLWHGSGVDTTIWETAIPHLTSFHVGSTGPAGSRTLVDPPLVSGRRHRGRGRCGHRPRVRRADPGRVFAWRLGRTALRGDPARAARWYASTARRTWTTRQWVSDPPILASFPIHQTWRQTSLRCYVVVVLCRGDR